MDKRTILLLAMATLVGFSFIGWVVMEFLVGIDLTAALDGSSDPLWQALVGGTYGALGAAAAWQIVRLPYLRKTNDFFTNLIGGIRLTSGEILFISLCAGTGEEILFRGALQPVLGIWLTSILFVALHGYLNPWNRPLSAYGLAMVVFILGIGFMAESLGLIAAICAHTVLDFILLRLLSLRWEKRNSEQ